MELRGCSQIHFIALISGGEVIKVPNISRGKTRPKLMNVEEIYLSSDLKCHDSLTNYPPKVDRSLAMPFDFAKVKTEVKTECMEEENELDFGAVTLRQLKNICKSNKRKASQSVNLTALKKDQDLQCQVDELDLKETLGSWKRKVLMKAKAKKRGILNGRSVSSTTNSVDARSKGTSADVDLLDVKPMNIKVEDAEDENSLQGRSLTVSDVFGDLTSNVVKACERCCPDTTSGYMQSAYPDQYSHEHLLQPVFTGESICDLNQVSYEHLDCAQLQNPLIATNPKIEEIIEADNEAGIGDHPLALCGSEIGGEEDMTNIMACTESTEIGLPAYGSSDIQIDCPHYKCHFHPPPDGQNAETTNFGETIESMENNSNIEGLERRDATKCNFVLKFNNYFPSANSMASLDKDLSIIRDKPLTLLDVTAEEVPASPMGPQNDCNDTDFINNGDASRYLDGNHYTEAKATGGNFKNCNVAVQDKRCLSLVNSVESAHNVTSAVENKQSSILDDAICPLTCSPGIQPSDSIDQQVGSAASEGHYIKEQQPPERLFSARKTISPNSKERLRKAMNCAEVQNDTQILACREKLFFDKNSVDTSSRSQIKKARIILTSKRLEALRATGIRTSRETLQKGKYERKTSLFRGTGNGDHASPATVHAASLCSTSQSCSQNAIAFSQQQMIDIERVAMKLLTELHSMKEMVVGTLHSESRTSAASRCNTDKATVAVENVKKVEETTKRWLSMMGRDCNRFCKIMELSEKKCAPPKTNDEHIPDLEICQNNPILEMKQDEQNLSPPKSTVQKERKIMFADEAGESLCHVRVL